MAATIKPTDTDKKLQLDREVDWEKDDQIVVTTTDYLPGHSEQLTIEKVETGMVTVEESVKYVHNGEPYDLSENEHAGIERLGLNIEVAGKPAAETRAAVALLTRYITIVSAGAAFPKEEAAQKCMYDCFPEQAGSYFGGHTLVRQGFEEYKVRGVEFYQLGNGGRLAHYPVHFHIARKTPKDTFVKDSSVHDSMTRCYTVHATHGVTLARNVGYQSIGHCYYIEDGSEINNKLYSNIGILARAAIDNVQNPRKVPGILADPGKQNGADVPYNSDNFNPSVFWIMNGWNDFQYNMAAGATGCGVCYWLVPGTNSGPSQGMKWESYASMQTGRIEGDFEFNLDRAGMTPLKTFRGNYCSSAMMSFNTVGATDRCLGIGANQAIKPIANLLAPPANGDRNRETFYPKVDPGGGRFATLCDTDDCSRNAIPSRCSAGKPRENCAVTVLDRYTSSFHWPQQNFAAIWLRPQWYLFSNSVLSDTQNGGLGFVTGGDYTQANVVPGQWQIATKSVFIGNTQDDNPLASNAGPFNPKGLECDNPEVNRCSSAKEGISMPLDNFAVNQRLYNIYDGPNYQDSNAYLDITKTDLGPACTPGNCPQHGPWMYTRTIGIPVEEDKMTKAKNCILPNAAIGWKQPNGFFYPPAFHSLNLFFHDVDIRHYVLEPLWKPGTFTTNEKKVRDDYCRFNAENTFGNFSSVDRQTVLNDDDGSLTGLVRDSFNPPVQDETISVNLDPFFNAPAEAPECASFDTAKTSPYEHVSTVVYPECAAKGTCSRTCTNGIDKQCTWEKECEGVCVVRRRDGEDVKECSQSPFNNPKSCSNDSDCASSCPAVWGRPCTNTDCYGVPLKRQLLTSEDVDPAADTTIRMGGMDLFQRSMLTLNDATYYIDTTVSEETQRETAESLNVFEKDNTYYVFLLYAKPTTRQTYQMYVGENGFNKDTMVKMVRANIETAPIKFPTEANFPSGWNKDYDSGTGILTVTMDLQDFAADFEAAKEDLCQPKDFCELKKQDAGAENETPICQCSQQLKKDDRDLYNLCTNKDKIAEDGEGEKRFFDLCTTWAGKDIDCPLDGCFGFSVKLPEEVAKGGNHRPEPTCFKEDEAPWNDVSLRNADANIAGEDCKNQAVPDKKFCN